jgi:hypothetical protein
MNQYRKKEGFIVVGVVALIGLLGYRLATSNHPAKTSIQSVVNRPVSHIISQPITYYKKGDPETLGFDKIDLGVGAGLKVSEQGDVLFKYAGSVIKLPGLGVAIAPRPPLFFRLRRKDGSVTDFPGAKNAFLTAKGRLFVIYDGVAGTRLEIDGKKVFDSKTEANGTAITAALRSIEAVTDDAIFYRSGDKGVISYLSPEMKLEQIPLPPNTAIMKIRSSSQLGTFLSLSQEDSIEENTPKYSKAKFVDGRVEIISFPSDCEDPSIAVCKDRVYFVPSKWPANNRIIEWHNNGYEPLPTIPGTVNSEVLNSNSSREFIIRGSEKSPDLKLSQGSPFWGVDYLVSHGQYYKMEKLMSRFKIPSGQLGLNSANAYFLGENGDIVVGAEFADGSHLYYLRRTAP